MKMGDSGGPVLHVIVVGFHHKKGCQVEYSYPPLIEGNSVESHEIPPEWKNIPSLSLPDGAHNYEKDTVFFLLPGREGSLETVYGVSCYRQMDAKNLINRTADVTRSTVQKSVCVLSKLPLFGLIKAKLELITHAYFDERDFSQVTLLEQTYNNLNSCLHPSLLEGTQVFLDLPVRQLLATYKHKIIVLFKLMLLERRVLVFGSPVELLCQTLLGLTSLFPGMLETGLCQACNQWNKLLSPTLAVANVDENEDEDEQFLEVRYQHSSGSLVNSDSGSSLSAVTVMERHNMQTKSKEAPVAPTIPRDSSPIQSAVYKNENNNVKPSTQNCQNEKKLELDISSNCDSPSSKASTDRSKEVKGDSPNSPDINFSQSGRVLARRSISNDSDKLCIHASNRNKKDSLTSDSEIRLSETSPPEQSPLAHISEITQIEAIQSGLGGIDIMSSPMEDASSRTGRHSLSLSSTKPLKDGCESIDELDSPESLLEIDNEDCFSWEQDSLQLTLHEDAEECVGDLKDSSSIGNVSEQDSKLSNSVSDSKESLDTEGSSRDSLSPESMHGGQSKSSDKRRRRKSKSNSPRGKAGKILKSKISAAFHKKNKNSGGESCAKSTVEGEVILQQDDYGHPLAIFTSGSVLYPYLSLQYHDILTDVNTRSFTIGATNILFKQRRQLIDALVEIEDGKVEIRDKELQRQLHLTTADLRFAEYLVKTVMENREGSFVDGTGWEGSEEWVRAQFKYYINSLLATVLQDDPKLLEDYGGSFLAAWKTTHNFRYWSRDSHPALEDIPLGHPFQGNLSMSDVRNRFNHTFQNTERGKKINAAVVQTGRYMVQTGKVVGGAITSAKSAVSTWFSSWRMSQKSPEGEEEHPGQGETTVEKDD